MGQSKNALVQIETGRNFHAAAAMVDSGDGKVFTISGGLVFSGKSGYEPVVLPNGIVTGYNLLSTSATNDTVKVAAFTANSKGVEQSPAATTATIGRPATDVSLVNSITMASDGSIAVVEGSDGSDANFSETRGAAGGPPLIPDESVEIGQVRVTTSAAGVVSADEIKQVPGTHVEYANDPGYMVNNIGEGKKATVAAKKNAFVEFYSALPDIHTSGAKPVYIAYYEPLFANVAIAKDFVPAEESHSISSEEYYGNQSIGSVSSSLGQASFTAVLTDGINDALVNEKNEIVTCKFFPNRLKTAYMLQQGTLGLGRTFPVDGQIQAAASLSAEVQSAEFAS
jgi:hypothetical protein